MEPDDEIQEYLDLSEEYLHSATRDVEERRFAPARLSLHQALELAVKAALMARTRTQGEEWTTHNVHGAFGRHFRDRVDPDTLARLSRLLQEYGRSRYPGWEAPSADAMRADLQFAARLIQETIPRLIQEA